MQTVYLNMSGLYCYNTHFDITTRKKLNFKSLYEQFPSKNIKLLFNLTQITSLYIPVKDC